MKHIFQRIIMGLGSILLVTGISYAAINTAPPEAANFNVQHGPTDAAFTGDMSLSVPLFTVPGRGGLDFPVALSYQAGIRVEQEASWVGLGWNFSPGAITRSIVGFPDERTSQQYYLTDIFGNLPVHDKKKAGWLVDTDSDYISEKDYLDWFNYSEPSGPDNYYLGGGSIGGRMILAQDDAGDPAFYLERWQAVQIFTEMTTGIAGHISKWTVRLPDGTCYVYEDIGITEEKTIYRYVASGGASLGLDNQGQELPAVTTVWPLVAILSSDYCDKNDNGPDDADDGNWIKFTYVTEPEHTEWIPDTPTAGDVPQDMESYMFDFAQEDPDFPDYYDYWYKKVQSNTIPYYLQKIETPIYKAEFEVEPRGNSYERTDFDRHELVKLNAVRLISKLTTEIIKEYKLSYHTDSNKKLAGKLTLASITEVDPKNPNDPAKMLPATTLEYYSGSQNPGINSTDAWGYYTWPENNHQPASDDVAARAWSLKRITYPTGGWTEYEYAPDYYNYVYIRNQDNTHEVSEYGGGLRLRKVHIHDGLDTDRDILYEYVYGEGIVYRHPEKQESGLRRPLFRFTDMAPHDVNYVGYTDVSVLMTSAVPGDPDTRILDQGKTVTEFYTYADYLVNKEYKNGLPKSTLIQNQEGVILAQSTMAYDFSQSNDPNYHETDMFAGCRLHTETLSSGWVRLESVYSELDEVGNTTEYEYNPENGLVNRKIEKQVSTIAGTYDRITEIDYAFQGAGIFVERHMLTQIEEQRVQRGTELVMASGTDWAYFFETSSGVYPYQSWVWLDNKAAPNNTIEANEKIYTLYEAYDAYGNLLEMKTPRGFKREYFYGDNTANYNNTPNLKSAFITGVKEYYDLTDPTKYLKSAADYNYSLGLPISITDTNGAVTTYDYDNYARLVNIKQPYDDEVGAGQGRLFSYYYAVPLGPDNLNRISTQHQREITRYGTLADVVAHNHTDGLGRTIRTEMEGQGTTLLPHLITRTVFDEFGLGKKAFKPYGLLTDGRCILANGTVVNNETAVEASNLYSFTDYNDDPLKRVHEVFPVYTSSAAASNEYGKLQTNRYKKIEDEKGNPSRLTYDKWNRLVQAESDYSTVTHTYARLTTTDYDILDRPVEIMNENPSWNKLTYQAYDTLGRVIFSAEPDLDGNFPFATDYNSTWDYELTYDDDGNLIQQKTPEGNIEHMLIDGLGRVIKTETDEGVSVVNHYDDYDFDSNGTADMDIPTVGGHLLNASQGRLTRTIDSSQGTEEIFFYDLRGRVGKKIVRIDDKEFSVIYEFCAGSDAIKKITAYDDTTCVGITEYDYYRTGWLHKVYVTPPGGSSRESASYEYFPTGSVKKVTLGSGDVINYTYTDRDWLETIDAGASLFQRHYDFDSVGNILKEYKGSLSNPEYLHAEYSYDNIYQLKTAFYHLPDYTEELNYTYDLLGNRTTYALNSNVIYYDYQNNTNLLYSAHGSFYDYDKNGNIKQKQSANTTFYDFDLLGRLNAVTSDDSSINEYYHYDPSGMRVKKVDSQGTTTYYVYQGNSVLYENQEIPQEISIELYEGWNFVSLPIEPLFSDVSWVLSSIEGYYEAVWTYDAASGGWKHYIIDGPPATLSAIEAGKGYEIYMNNPATLVVRGRTISDPAIQLYEGWNLVGYNAQTSKSIQEALVSIEWLYNSVQTYDTPTDDWLTYVVNLEPAFLNNLDNLEPKRAYWIDAREDFVLDVTSTQSSGASAFTEVISSPPPSPNCPPVIQSGPTVNPNPVNEDETATVTVTADDPEQSSLTYSWSTTGGTITGNGSTAIYTPPDIGIMYMTYTITVTIFDGQGGEVSGEVDVTVNPVVIAGETPWKDNENGTLYENLSGGKTVGYKFTPLQNGHITSLGGCFQGAEILSLWDYTTGDRLDSVEVSSSGNWNYVTLDSPIAVIPEHSYIVSLYSDEPGLSSRRLLADRRLPQTYGNIRIERGCQGDGDDIPNTFTKYYMYGQVDIEFVPGGIDPPDTTPPITPVVTDDGSTTTNSSQLHAVWSSSDPESGIAEYQYAIGTTQGGTNVVDWTSTGTTASVTKTGLNLTEGSTYYFSVKAKNAVELWSTEGYSDGITVADTETPWKDNENGTLYENLSGGKTVGYKFIPLTDGRIISLGGCFQGGSKTVSLWDNATQTVLASVPVTSNGSWCYSTLPNEIEVTAGHGYTVTLYSDEPGRSSRRLLADRRLPQTYGNIRIERGCQGDGDDIPNTFTKYYMYGQVDIEFVPDE